MSKKFIEIMADGHFSPLESCTLASFFSICSQVSPTLTVRIFEIMRESKIPCDPMVFKRIKEVELNARELMDTESVGEEMN